MTEPRVSGLRLAACIGVLQDEPVRREVSLDLALDLWGARQRIVELEAKIDRLETPAKERSRKVGPYWLTPEGRSELNDSFPDATDGNAVRPLLDRIAELEAENTLLRQSVVTYDEQGESIGVWTPVEIGRLAELEALEAKCGLP